MSKKITILSIDGGGIRGILPGVILAYLEQKLQEKEGAQARLCDYFDLLAGTSTGGILTCMYITPSADGRPLFTASEAVDLYLKNGGIIFSRSWWYKLRTLFGLLGAKYPVINIERILKSYLKNVMLKDALKPCLVTAYDIVQRKTVFFNKTDTIKSDIFNYHMRDIARSTSAAPTYFKPVKIESLFGAPLYMIDGGVFANNPAMCAYAEARTTEFSKIFNRPDKPDYPNAKNMIMISIGTGTHSDPYNYNKVKKWGAAYWALPIINILMSSNAETVHYELNQMFDTIKPPDQADYYRLEPTVGTASSQMDLATSENMHALEEAGKTFVTANVGLLDKIVDLLIANK
ncbi:MAG: patatin-like phospholipase family protein [Lentimicrobiaceae bacterium]|nr:patatin-like phospholipase family protein [Lentimicrobiaceae bacterium]